MTTQYHPSQRYVALENNGMPHVARPPGHPPQFQYRPPLHYSGHKSSRRCGCLRCLCCCFYFSCCRWCMCILCTLLLIMVGIIIGLYYYISPQISSYMPSYNIENFDVKGFDIKNNKLYTDIVVNVKAENPNPIIGLEYLENDVLIKYSGFQLSKGKFPYLMQPPKNIAIVNLAMKGATDFGIEIQQRLLEDQKMRHIPLLIEVKVPITIVLDQFFRLKRFVVLVNCSLVIDGLQPNIKPKILQKDFTYVFNPIY